MLEFKSYLLLFAWIFQLYPSSWWNWHWEAEAFPMEFEIFDSSGYYSVIIDISRWIPFRGISRLTGSPSPLLSFLPSFLSELIKMQAPIQANLHLETIFKSPFRRTGKSIVVEVIREASGSPFFLSPSLRFFSFSTVLVKTPETVELGTEYHKSAISESDAICYAD